MSRCKNCNVEILDVTEVCPLCRSVLIKNEEMEDMYPNALNATKKLIFASRIYLFSALVIVLVLVGVDAHIDLPFKLSLLVGSILFYVYMILRYAIIGKMGYINKTMVLVVTAVLLAIGIDFSTGYRGWSVEYVISSGILIVDIGILVLMICNRRNWQSYIMWQLSMLVLSLIPPVLYWIGVEKNPYFAFTPITATIMLFVGTVLLGGHRAETELKRRFHI